MATLVPLSRYCATLSARVPNRTQPTKLATSSHSPVLGFLRRSFTATHICRTDVPPWVRLSSGSRVRLPDMVQRLIDN